MKRCLGSACAVLLLAVGMAGCSDRLFITTPHLPGGAVGSPYHAPLQARGGSPPYVWSVVWGSLPDGLTLDASSGEISGNPSALGRTSFTVQVEDSAPAQHRAQAPVLLEVRAQGEDDGTIPAPRPYLILHNNPDNIDMTPDLVAENADTLDKTPFDGLYVSLGDLSLQVMDGTSLDYDTIAARLKPMKDKKLKKVTQNFALVVTPNTGLPDFFDDWGTITQNFAHVARAARDAGLVGIAFDNEDYAQDPDVGGITWSTYPDDCKYKSASLADYQGQAHQRGKEIMAAMIAEFPAIVVVVLHGPYLSVPEPHAPPELAGAGNDLHGPLFVGFVEVAKEAHEQTGATAQVVDGGELYHLRTDTDFEIAYRYRKLDIASDATDCPFIPELLRPSWPSSVDVGFGLYDLQEAAISAPLLDVSVVQSNVTNALRHSDSWVWFFTNKVDFLHAESAGGAPEAWVEAVRRGKEDGLAGWEPSSISRAAR